MLKNALMITYFFILKAKQQHFFHQREPCLFRITIVDILFVVEFVGRLTVLSRHAVVVVPVDISSLHQTVGAAHHLGNLIGLAGRSHPDVRSRERGEREIKVKKRKETFQIFTRKCRSYTGCCVRREYSPQFAECTDKGNIFYFFC